MTPRLCDAEFVTNKQSSKQYCVAEHALAQPETIGVASFSGSIANKMQPLVGDT